MSRHSGLGMQVHKYACRAVDIGIEMWEGAAFGRPLLHFYDDVDSLACLFLLELCHGPLRAYAAGRHGPVCAYTAGLHTPPTPPWGLCGPKPGGTCMFGRIGSGSASRQIGSARLGPDWKQRETAIRLGKSDKPNLPDWPSTTQIKSLDPFVRAAIF